MTDPTAEIRLARFEAEAAGMCPDSGQSMIRCAQSGPCDCGLEGATAAAVEEYRLRIAEDLRRIREGLEQ